MRFAQRWWAGTLFVLAFLFASVGPGLAVGAQTPVATDEVHGINIADMDLNVDPAEDFYRFANGGWLDRTELSPDSPVIRAFEELDDLTDQQLLTVIEELVASDDVVEGSNEWILLRLYQQGMDVEARNEHGLTPIAPVLSEIAAIESLADLHVFQQTAPFEMVQGLFMLGVGQDLRESSAYSLQLSGPFLGLPSRDYYLEEDPELQGAYIETMAALLVLVGYDEAEAEDLAAAVFEFEQRLAEPTYSVEEAQDYATSQEAVPYANLAEIYPLMDWDAYLEAIGVGGTSEIILTEGRYLEALPEILESTAIETIRAYLSLEVLWSYAPFLTEELEATVFAFQGGVLSGVTEQRPLEVRTLDIVNAVLPDALGQLYVERYFPPEAKEQITELAYDIVAAFRIRILDNEWMSAETKIEALKKLEALQVKVGYPDTWESYDDISVGDTFADTIRNAFAASLRDDYAKFGTEVDRSEWDISPQTVNAYYAPLNNEIVFPAAILQPPFFDYQADPASNYGAIGFIIGHEITHGFDLSGSQFDAEGNLRDWWTAADRAAFMALNDRVVEQYNEIELLPGVFQDGRLTVTENVADLGGLQAAYDALQIQLAAEGPIEEIDGFTQEQRFFIAAATVWRMEATDAFIRLRAQIDPHASGPVRAVQPARNMDAFYEAFDIGPEDPMYLAPEDRVVIW